MLGWEQTNWFRRIWGMFVERWDLLVNTHWAKDSWYSGDARDAGVLKDLTLCSVNSRKSSYGNYTTACLWSWRAFPKTFSGVNIALYSVPLSKSLLIKTTIKQHLKCCCTIILGYLLVCRQKEWFSYKWLQNIQKSLEMEWTFFSITIIKAFLMMMITI